jgi:hypothetical protein
LETDASHSNKAQSDRKNLSFLLAMKELLTSRSQAYWQERIQKETAFRATWNVRYGHKYLQEGTRARKQTQQAPFRSAMVMAPVPATISPVYKEVQGGGPETQRVQDQLSRAGGVQSSPPKEDRLRQTRGATQSPADQSSTGNLEMRKVPSSTLKLLFQGISHDGQGRAQYLRKRYQQAPEEKFRYPILSSWEYGWNLGKATVFLPFQAFGRQAMSLTMSPSWPTELAQHPLGRAGTSHP